MRFIHQIFFFLIFLYIIEANQVFIKSGTGLKGVSHQMKLKGMREGCLFMAACVIGGLGSDKEIMLARKWSVQNKYIRDSDTYVNMDARVLAQKISKKFKTNYHANWKFKKGSRHWWVVNEKGVEIFNSAGLGYHK